MSVFQHCKNTILKSHKYRKFCFTPTYLTLKLEKQLTLIMWEGDELVRNKRFTTQIDHRKGEARVGEFVGGLSV